MKKINEFYKNNKFLIFLAIFSFILRISIVIFIKTPIESDFKLMYDAAVELINGTKTFSNLPYFTRWGYQMGHVIYQTLLLKVFNSVLFLKIFNCLITTSTVIMIYLIAKLVTNEKYAKIASSLYAVFPFSLFLNTVLTNQHLPILLTLIAIYILLKIDFNTPTYKSILIGLLLGISNILRSEGIVFIFSIFLYYIFLFIKKINIKKLIYSFFLIYISYFLIFQGASLTLKKTGLSINGLNNMNPTWKFVLGFNYETNGMYSTDDADKYADSKELSKKIVIERIKDYKKIPSLFLKKTKILWFNSDLNWSLGYINNTILYKILNIINQIFILIFNIFSGISLLKLFRKKLPNNDQFLITTILAVYFGVYLLIEIMPRYAYSLHVFEAILLSIGIEFIVDKVNNNRKTHLNKN